MASEWDIGDLVLRDGRLALCDPLLVLTADWAAWFEAPRGQHAVEILTIEDPHGDERIDRAAIFFEDDEPARWEFAAAVPVDSGILAFGTPEAIDRLIADDDTLVDELLDDMRENRMSTYETGGAPGLVACTGGLGDGFAEVYLGFGADGSLACLSVDFLDDGEVEQSPGRGLQRAFLAPARFGGDPDPRTVVGVPMELNRARTTVERTAGWALLSGSGIDLEVSPRYDGDSPVPIELKATLRTEPSRE